MLFLGIVAVIVIAFLLFNAVNFVKTVAISTDNPNLIVEKARVDWMGLVTSETGLMCGATAITRRILVSAAHCVCDSRNVPLFVNISGKIRSVVDIVIHPEYSSETLQNDICLLFIDGDAEDVLPLPEESLTDGETCFVCGWGLTEENKPSTVLRTITVRVMDSVLCSHEYGDDFDTSGKQICAGNVDRPADFCRGDSGGPLFTDNPPVLRGIVSYTGIQCATGRPSVYTDVYYHRNWIVSHI